MNEAKDCAVADLLPAPSQFGINQFTEMSISERARFLGMRRSTRSAAEAHADNVAALQASRNVSLTSLEAAAAAAFAAAGSEVAAAGGVRANELLEDLPDWCGLARCCSRARFRAATAR